MRYLVRMDEFLLAHGLAALFVVSFLAATLLPMGSEWLLAALVLKGVEPVSAIAVATLGNTLGACTNYGIGLLGSPLLVRRLLRMDDAAQRRAENLYTRFGSWSLLMSWVPVVGDPLCVVGGIFRIHFGRFVALVGLGKLARYIALVVAVQGGAAYFGS